MILQPIFVVQFQSYSTKGQVYMCSIDFSLHFDKILEFCRGFVLIINRLTLKYARPTPCQQRVMPAHLAHLYRLIIPLVTNNNCLNIKNKGSLCY